MTGRVVCVDGWGFRGFLPGLSIVKDLAGKGYTVMQLPYNNFIPTKDNVQSAARTGLDIARSGDDPAVFVGASMGAQVLCAMLRELGGGKKRLGDWKFVLIGNPEHAYTGRVTTPDYGGVGFPSDTPYDVMDVAAQWDYWADVAKIPKWSLWTKARYYAKANGVHTIGYFDLDPTLPYPCVREGNAKHMWVPGDNEWLHDNAERHCDRPVRL